MQTSTDAYMTYQISVFKPWYVYRRKPKWFGQYAHDRYLGKLRWISHHADGKQWRNADQHGDIHHWTVSAGTSEASSKTANQLIRTYGYTRPYFTSPDLRNSRKQRDYYKGIRCAHCGITNAEVERNRYAVSSELSWPKGSFTRGMDSWDARQVARESVICRCDHTPNQAAIDAAIKTGEPIRY